MFIAALFIIAKKWKQSKFSTYKWIHKMWYSHRMGYDSPIKENKVLRLAIPWMNLEQFCYVKVLRHKDKNYNTQFI